MSWNLLLGTIRTESIETPTVATDESCHVIGWPAVKRCFASVYHAEISEADRLVFVCGLATGPANIFARTMGTKDAALIAPNPKADFLRNDLREFRLFVCFMLAAIVYYLVLKRLI